MMIQERAAVADFIAVALCVAMGRGFCDCSRKDMAVAAPDCIAIGLLLVIGRFWDRSGTFPIMVPVALWHSHSLKH